jgi:DNA-binding transcriptional ArsR family regulator
VAPMVLASVPRPLIAFLIVLYALVLGAAVAQAAPLEVEAPGFYAAVEAPGLAAAPAGAPIGLDSVAPMTTANTLFPPFDAPLAGTSLAPLPVLDSDAGSTTRSESTTGSAWPTAPARQAAEVAAAGAVAATGMALLKFEPVRRAAFLLALPLYSRLRRHELLENGVRERIYRSVESQPGLSIIQVCRVGKVGWGTAVYHLQRLERDKLIVSRRDGQYRRFFLNGQAPDPHAAQPAQRTLAHPLAQRIAAFVVANPQVAQKDVCAALGIAPPLASKWLGRLQEAGLLTSQREWKLVRYTPTPALLATLAALPATTGQPPPVEVAASG